MRTFIRLLLLALLFCMISGAHAVEIVDVDVSSGRSGFNIDYWLEAEGQGNVHHINDDQGQKGAATPAGEFNIIMDGRQTFGFCVEIGPAVLSGNAALTNPRLYIDHEDSDIFDYNGLHAAWLMDRFSTGLGFDEATLPVPSQYTGNVYTGPGTYYTRTFDITGSITDDIADVALQIAIWETIYDYDKVANNFNGRNYFSNAIISSSQFDYKTFEISSFGPDGDFDNTRILTWALSEYYLSELMRAMEDGTIENDFSGNFEYYIADFSANSVDSQEILIARAIPEPGTMMLFSFGLLGIGALGRKKS